MKSILLATASILAFAGAASADVVFGGSATLGFNEDNGSEPRDEGDTDVNGDVDNGEGFFWEADLGVTLTQELNNGVTATASFGLNITDEDASGQDDVGVDDDFLLSLTTEQGGLFFGDTEFAAFTHWDAAGNMLADRFSEQDDEIVLRGDALFGGVEASVSYTVADAEEERPQDDLDQLSIGASGTLARFTFSVAYQEESEIVDNPAGEYQAYDDFEVSEVFALSAGTTFGGADVAVAYASDQTLEDSSLGFEVAYPVGPVTLGAYYVLEENDASDFDAGFDDIENSLGVSADYASGPLSVSAFYEIEDDGDAIDNPEGGDANEFEGDDDDENSNYGLEVGYDSGAGIEFYAGYIQEDGGYAGVEYDLGNGAELIASYADEDEEGAREYEGGTTVLVSLEF
ncbi:porin [Rubellimicrobium roseum]|uniref:Porin n=2 Tax=Rubellimicrobium roseum TaxID=687525 RepID=A0A5C4ND57_9RHOB|nr:porin [Rubellimicrobium roseum]